MNNMIGLRATANFFIERGLRDKAARISPLKLQKLLFFAYGLFLVKSENGQIGQPLFSKRFEVWAYGPVLPCLYYMFKGYGNNPIDRLIQDVFIDSETLEWKTHIPLPDQRETEVVTFLAEFWKVYKDYDVITLSNVTHLPNTPWSNALKEGKKVIPDGMMFDYFKDWGKTHEGDA